MPSQPLQSKRRLQCWSMSDTQGPAGTSSYWKTWLGVRRQCHEAPAFTSPSGAAGQLGKSCIRFLRPCSCRPGVSTNDPSRPPSTARERGLGRKTRSLWVLALAVKKSSWWTALKGGHLLPPSLHPMPPALLAAWSLTQQVRSRLLQGGCTVLAPLRPPGYHGVLLLPGRERNTWGSQVFTKKLSLHNLPPPTPKAGA